MSVDERKLKKLSLALLISGACLMLGGFIFAVMFVGVPYQDPTPAMRAHQDRIDGIATKAMQAGFVALGAGALSLIIFKLALKKERRPPAKPRHGEGP